MSDSKPMKTLYVVLTKDCMLDCPFCFNHYSDKYKKLDKGVIDTKTIIDTINDMDPDSITFIGGEPLLYPETIIDVLNYFDLKDTMNKRSREWSVSSNLYYKNLSQTQIEALDLLQRMSSEDIAIGTSFSLDRFRGMDSYFDRFVKNMWRLDKIGINVGVTVTVTEAQLDQNVLDLKRVLERLKYKSINLERCLFPMPKTDTERRHLEYVYRRIDEYMKECFKVFPKEKNYQYHRYYDCAKYGAPLMNPNCSKVTKTLYSHGLYNGCALNPKAYIDSDDNEDKKALSKLQIDKLQARCLKCKFYKYCRGDCECVRGVCAFPKKTISYLIDEVKSNEQMSLF